MIYNELTAQMHQYLDHTATQSLSKWLERNLPTNHNDWWAHYVLDRLSENQRELVAFYGWTSLQQLDLSALLRVANSNWNDIRERSGLFLPQSERSYIEQMFKVRNRWSHCNSEIPTTDVVINDIDTMLGFFATVGLSYDERKEVEAYKRMVERDGVSDAPTKRQNAETSPLLSESAVSELMEIGQGSIVRLRSDPNKKGAVISVDEVGTVIKYLVFIDSAPKSFFDDQIELDAVSNDERIVEAVELSRIITAYQINKPTVDSLYSLNSARVDFVPYQFRPALKLIKSETPRLLIADSVGVGKTIEAGLILKEMQARMPLDSVLIICPKPLVVERKWETEMKRFDEEFIPVDGATLRNIIKDCDREGEWPERYRRAIVPYSLLQNPELIDGSVGRRNMPGLTALDPPPMFDMVIVDEAHHIRNSSAQVHKAVKYFVEHANAVLFLTATPLQLGDDDLFTLLNLLFPDVVIDKATFRGMAESNPFINKAVSELRRGTTDIAELLEPLRYAASTDWGRTVIASNPVYHRVLNSVQNGFATREQRIKLISDIESLHSFSGMINRTRRQDIGDFCVRRADTLASEFTLRQQELHDALLDFEADALRAMYGNIPLKFLMTTISRQAASCIFGLAPAIKAIINRNVSKLTDDYDVPDNVDIDSVDLRDFEEKALVLIALAENLPNEDPKFDALYKILTKKQEDNNNKVIVFSSFKHTLRYLDKKIREECNLRVAQIHGDVDDEERCQLRERFALPCDNERALDVLLFTEVGSEGLDYQFCANMVNYDIPWNPMRIEQRIGRIDRRGQQSEVVHIYNCVTTGTIDAEIYERCLKRIGIFEHSIGDCEEILGGIADSINKIVFDTNLTSEERAQKLEHLADNEVREIAALQELESEQRQMFGLDISNFTEDIDKAENQWLSALSVKRLVEGYLSARLGTDKSYITGSTLRLSREAKDILLTDLKSVNALSVDKKWTGYLKGGEQYRNVAFEQDKATQDPKAIFITAMHPLARQAAKHFAFNNPIRAYLTVCSTEVSAGLYPFRLYLWEYTGNRPEISITAVCDNETVGNELMVLLQNAVESDDKQIDCSNKWDKLEGQHYAKWQIQRLKYREEAVAHCRYKMESLAKSVGARRNTYNQQLANNTNEKVRAMLNNAIQNLDADFASKKSKLERDAELADIHATLIVSGLLTVQGE